MRLISANLDDLKRLGWDVTRIADAMLALDKKSFPEAPVALLGTPDQWTPILLYQPECWGVLITPSHELIAYWHMTPIDHNTFIRVIDGTVLDADLGMNDILNIRLPQWGFLYLDSFTIHPDYLADTTAWRLMREWLRQLEHLARIGVFFESLSIRAYSPHTLHFCIDHGWSKAGPNDERHGQMLRMDTEPLPALPWARRFRALGELYDHAWQTRLLLGRKGRQRHLTDII